VIEERKCFACGGFGHMAYNCRNMGEERSAQVPLDKFEVLKDRREILREERVRREIKVRQTKVEREEKKEKYLREVMVKIGLKQEEEEEGIVSGCVVR